MPWRGLLYEFAGANLSVIARGPLYHEFPRQQVQGKVSYQVDAANPWFWQEKLVVYPGRLGLDRYLGRPGTHPLRQQFCLFRGPEVWLGRSVGPIGFYALQLSPNLGKFILGHSHNINYRTKGIRSMPEVWARKTGGLSYTLDGISEGLCHPP